MKPITCINLKKNILKTFISLIMLSFCACKVDDVATYYTFTGETVGQYLESRPDDYSEFTELLIDTDILYLLKAYGKYTCFVPTNDAMKKYYKSIEISSWKDLSDFDRQKLVYDHIIKDATIREADFRSGILTKKSMNDRFISISYDYKEQDGYIYINDSSPILMLDDLCHNGVIHSIGEVLQPTQLNIVEALEATEKYKIFMDALKATDLDKLLLKEIDAKYNPEDYSYIDLSRKNPTGKPCILPEKRKYGYTVFVESDELYNSLGINNLDDLKKEAARIYDIVYPNDRNIKDITNRKNSLNRFIAYHIIEKQVTKYMLSELYMDGSRNNCQKSSHIDGCEMLEYLETMCPNTLMEIKSYDNHKKNFINHCPVQNGKFDSDQDYYINIINHDGMSTNGIFHEVDKILSYNMEFVSIITSKRLRMDAAGFFNELYSNNMRDYEVGYYHTLPPGYLDKMSYKSGTTVFYVSGYESFTDYQGDEFMMMGSYDFEITTPPIPAGTYEVRFAYQPNGNRGVAQLYWDNKPADIPLDLRLAANHPKIGWEKPGDNSEDPYGYENDKMMRNRGYMKGGASYRSPKADWYPGINARYSTSVVRRIIGKFSFPTDTVHTLRVKAVKEGQFNLDRSEERRVGKEC